MTDTRHQQHQQPAILLVEDELPLAQMLQDALEAKGYRVWHATTAAGGEALLDEVRPDLVICDLLLPDASGLVLCADLAKRADAPIVVCSGTKRRDDRVLSFKLGADDFIPKPFDVTELLARIEASLRRAARRKPAAPPPERARERVGTLAIDRTRCRVTVGGREVALTPTEYRLLCALVERPNAVFSRQELAERIWGTHDAGIDRSLDVHMRRLRAKLRSAAGAAAPAPPLVTLRGFGYQLVHDPPREPSRAA
jgi:DNA-binding response OmpR family regulator